MSCSSAISALGTVIDTDHWRHFYLLLGLIWGGIALEYRHQRSALPASARPQARQIAPLTAAPVAASRANRSLLAI